MMEGEYRHPKTCFEIMKRGFELKKKFPNGIYEIEPTPGNVVKTFCEMNRHSGGWTLVTASMTKTGWTTDNIGLRNEMLPTSGDYSIFKYIDNLKLQDLAETGFDYMIEANGENQHGGIFSYSAKPSLMTCPQKGYLPKLIKKFGTWDEATENIANYPVFPTSLNGVYLKAGKADTSDVYGAIVTSSVSSNKYMKSLPNPTYVKVWIREGGSRKSCNDIAIHGYHKSVSDYKDGYYMLQNLQLVYCDMEYSPKEGWTLLVTSTSNGWTRETVLTRNKDKPSLTDNYSILSQANTIKQLSNGKTFKYMLDANQRHRWGGTYQAPIDYVFDFKAYKHPTVQIKQFDEWEKTWYSSVKDDMPWLGNPSHGRALLTTSGSDDSNEAGTICAADSQGNDPAKWITSEMSNPGNIWYWLNENDCNNDYKKIDGKYSQWSMWTQCAMCKSDKQSRKRICSDPAPRCCGDVCDPNESTYEQRDCTGECPATRIIDPDNKYCFEPQTGGCSPDDDTPIVLRPTTTHCNDESSKFIYDPQTGTLNHLCSKKRVCTNDPVVSGGTLKVSSKCHEFSSSHALYRTLYGSLQYGVKRCFDSAGSSLSDNDKISIHSTCEESTNRFIFKDIAKPSSVLMQVYKLTLSANTVAELKLNRGYPNSVHAYGLLDNFATTSNIGSDYQARLSAYFIAPMTGSYRFVAACDDECAVSLSNKPTDAGSTVDQSTMVTILNITDHTGGRFNWDKYFTQKSGPIDLKVGSKYYLEGLMVEDGGDDYLSVGVYLPDGTPVLPITSHYLSQTA